MDSDVSLLFHDFLEPVSLQNNTWYAEIFRPMIRMINDSSLIYTVLCDTLFVKVRWLFGGCVVYKDSTNDDK